MVGGIIPSMTALSPASHRIGMAGTTPPAYLAAASGKLGMRSELVDQDPGLSISRV
jgi:hypothetical protein